jgi:hypothetical protein
MAFSLSSTFVLNQLVVDKADRMRETLRIMSLNRWSYAASYFCTQAFFAILTAISLFIGFTFAFSNQNEIVPAEAQFDPSAPMNNVPRELFRHRDFDEELDGQMPPFGMMGPDGMQRPGGMSGKSIRQYATLLAALMLLGMNVVALSMALSTLFKDANFSTQGGLLLMFIPTSFLFFLFVLIWD